jgi:hypothetical protein
VFTLNIDSTTMTTSPAHKTSAATTVDEATTAGHNAVALAAARR